MIVCGNPASVLSSLNTHCIKMYALAHTHAHPPTHRKRQGVRLVHSGSLASSQPLNTSTAHYSVAWQALSHMLALRTSEDYPATRFRQQSHIYIYHPFIHFPHSQHTSLSMHICPVNSSLKGTKFFILQPHYAGSPHPPLPYIIDLLCNFVC